jgi:hypothetical protein
MKSSWKKLLPLIGIILFIYIISRLDFLRLWQIINKADYQYFLFLPLTVFLILYLQTLKWQVLLRGQGIKLRFVNLFKIHLISNYYAFITPSRLGYFAKIPYLQNSLKDSMARVSSSVIIDRILDIFILFLFALAGSLLLLSFYPSIFISLLIVGLIFIILTLFFYSKKRARFFVSPFKKFIPERFRDRLRDGFNGFYDGFPIKKKLLVPILLTLATWFVVYSQAYLIALALNININYWHFIILLPISTIVSLLPITISGLGTREATLILVFSNYSISLESIVAMSLIGFILVYSLPAFVGGFLSFKFSL